MKLFKRFLSIILALTIFISTVHFTDLNALAQLRDTALSAIADVANKISGISLTADQETCEHDYIISTTRGNPTCTKSGTVAFKCTLCGATKTEKTALGHYYECISDNYGNFSYKCQYCDATTSAQVSELYPEFQPNINKKPKRNNNNCLLDVVCDGIINAKDFAKIKRSENTISPTTLSNQNSTETTKRVYRYLCAMYGNKTISAQQESTWMGSPDYEINYIYNNTGKYPAMRGLDYMHDDFSGVNSRAVNWWNRGGLVTICWHTGSDFTGEWSDAMNDTVPDWNAMLTEGTAAYNQMIAGMDKAAQALLQLKNNGVTVLWRPFHEFDGQWFWWGKDGAANFKKMWQIMYDRYTNYWGLNNLIWVLGYSHNITRLSVITWNPGADYYDILAADTYSPSEYAGLYTVLNNYTLKGDKPIALHECGQNPTESTLSLYPYTYFMTWHTAYITDDNTASDLSTLYNSDRVITLDEVNYNNY